MPLTPWNPFRSLDKFFEEDWIPMFPFKINEPAMDVYQTDKDVVVEVNLPGIDPSKVDISIENNTLYLKGGVSEEKEEKKKNYYFKEIKKGAFERTVVLPAEVEEDKAKASYKDGVLKIVVPKTKASRTRKKIEIKVEKKKK